MTLRQTQGHGESSRTMREHFKNWHHAYLIEGEREKVLLEITSFCEESGIPSRGNPDFCHITVQMLKIEDARNLKELAASRAFYNGKKIFVITVENILSEAQNTLLKLFEEPTPETHFFLVLPDANVLLKTFASRFYRISGKAKQEEENVKEFVAMSKSGRINFLKELLSDEDNARTNANKFLNDLESYLHSTARFNLARVNIAEQIMKAREYLRQPGASMKNLLESVALML